MMVMMVMASMCRRLLTDSNRRSCRLLISTCMSLHRSWQSQLGAVAVLMQGILHAGSGHGQSLLTNANWWADTNNIFTRGSRR